MSFFDRYLRLPSGVVEVGWLLDGEKATFIWETPRRLVREESNVKHAKSVRFCPAVLDHDARLFEVLSPIDMHLRFSPGDGGAKKASLVNAAGDQSTIRSKHLGQMITLVSEKEWRHPNRPVIQMITPYVFLSDEPVQINQVPPYLHYRSTQLPGVLISGRFPIEVWPRQLMWAFEWHEPSKDIIVKRGEPLFYVQFEAPNPKRPVRLVEAVMTPELRTHINGMSGVTNYVNRTFSLFDIARQRRPKTLLTKKT